MQDLTTCLRIIFFPYLSRSRATRTFQRSDFMMIHHFLRWRFLIMARDERSGWRDWVGKKWNLAVNFSSEDYCHCVPLMRKKKRNCKSRRICDSPMVFQIQLQACLALCDKRAGGAQWAARWRKLAPVDLEVNFKPMSEILVSHLCLRASGWLNLGLFAGHCSHLCLLAKYWLLIGHIRANL